MSVSTLSQPGYNKFYDDQSFSSGGSVDTFVNKKGRRRVSSARRTRSQRDLDAKQQGGLFTTLLAPFYNCCSPQLPAAQLGGGGVASVTSGQGYTHSDLDTDSEDANTDETSSSGTFDAYAMGVGPQLRQKEASQLPEGEKSALWRITPPPKTIRNANALSPEQKEYAALRFCLRMEGSSHMNEKLVVDVLKIAAAQAPQVSLMLSLKRPEFAYLSLVRVIEARTVEEILGDLITAVEEVKQGNNNGAVYAIVSKVRCCAIYARQQGEAMVLATFDPSSTDRRGPAIFGFKQITDVDKFVSALYSRDPEVRRTPSGLRFKSFLLIGKTTYEASAPTANKEWALPPTYAKDEVQNELKLEAKRRADPKYDAKLLHGAMYKAAARPVAGEKQVFSYDPSRGLQVAQRQESSDEDTSSDE